MSNPRLLLRLLVIGLGVGAVVLGIDHLVEFWLETNWFAELGYVSVLLTRTLAHWGLGLLAVILTSGLIWLNFRTTCCQQRLGWLWIPLLGIGVLLAQGLSDHWLLLLGWLRQVPVGKTDPIFGRDLSFFFFGLPFWESLQAWGRDLVLVLLIGVAIVRVTDLGLAKQGRFWVLCADTQRQLLILTGSLFVLLAWGHWLQRFALLYSSRGIVFGAGYADVHARLPGLVVEAAIALAIAIACFWIARHRIPSPTLGQRQFTRRIQIWTLAVPLGLACGYGLSGYLLGQAIPTVLQSLTVGPSEFARERPYIRHNLRFTQEGFGLTEVESLPFAGDDTPTYADLQANAVALKNIRLWDPDPLLASYRQLQEIRPYYQFPNVDSDRYVIGGEIRQVMLSARELDFARVPNKAQTWVNQHFYYTHGYGLALSPINVVTPQGLPAFFIADIPPRASDPAVRRAIPLFNPAIYYGELTNTNVFVNTMAQELDYPQAEQNIMGRYRGAGGIAVGAWWQRWLMAWYLRDPRILPSRDLTSESRILLRRQIMARVQHLAPFLRYDRDPYLVVAEGQLFWLLDAYTHSDRFPYSESATLPPHPSLGLPEIAVNYLRNAVKVAIDAYDGSVRFYVADPQDPLIQNYRRLFPSLFRDLAQLPAALRPHLRYPYDLFQVQAQQFASYHVTDPQIFYNREDQWQIPMRVRNNRTLPLPPQYVMATLPEQQTGPSDQPEFVVLTPFTPEAKQNLTAWLVARSDGSHYGKLRAYEFSRQRLVFGPQQVEARINQDPTISEQLSLWNQHGSRVNLGAMMVLPLTFAQQSALLYVQPLFLEAESSRLPQLIRVIVAHKEQVAMRPSLDQALRSLFPPQPGGSTLSDDLALNLWNEGQEALRQGDWVRYGQIQTELRNILERLQQSHRASQP